VEITVEHGEIDWLLRKALASEGIKVPEEAEMVLRRNNKRGTLRIVFRAPRDNHGRKRGGTE